LPSPLLKWILHVILKRAFAGAHISECLSENILNPLHRL